MLSRGGLPSGGRAEPKATGPEPGHEFTTRDRLGTEPNGHLSETFMKVVVIALKDVSRKPERRCELV
jgi:hypothetical protein